MAKENKHNNSIETHEVANCNLKPISHIENHILTIRDFQVMLDRDLAELYGIETKFLNLAVKRNIERFPANFMFQLTHEEFDSLRLQFVTSNGRGGNRYLPYAFTEQGVAMLSAVLRSPTAISVSVKIMEAFVTMRRFLISNAQVFHRVQNLEMHQLQTDKKIDTILNKLESHELPIEGIFYDGQIFDAHTFVCDLIRNAKQHIVLIDNYIDDTVLKRLDKRKAGVSATIYTQRITAGFQNDIDTHNAQYSAIVVKVTTKAHDRFIIIDDTVYHIGASIKDLGKKIFAFGKMNISPDDLISHFI
jgi:hypothetical protein